MNSHQKWVAENTTRVVMNLNHNTDKDVLEKLSTVQSKQGYIKALIRADIATKKELTLEELERRRAEVDTRPPEKPTAEDLAAFAEAGAEDPAEAVTLEEYKASREYSGTLMLRVPKELHKALAEAAKANGVSLNQYALYKLSK